MKKYIITVLLVQGSLLSLAQSKVVINDFSRFKTELVSIKSEAEAYAGEIKNTWQNAAEKSKGKGMYIQLSAAVDGVIDQVKTIILRPKLVNESLKSDINADLEKLKLRLAAFNEFYVSGNLTPGDTTVPETSILAMFEVGRGFIAEFKKILNHQREELAREFEKNCKFRRWDEL
jgi:hypothetical protein